MRGLYGLALVLLIIGGLNWLLIGLFNLNVIDYLGAVISRIIYILVGLSAIIAIFGKGGKTSQPTAM